MIPQFLAKQKRLYQSENTHVMHLYMLHLYSNMPGSPAGIFLYIIYIFIYIILISLIFILCSSLFLSQLSNSEAQNPQNLIPSHSFGLGHRHRAVAPRRKDMDLPRAHLLRIVPAEVGRPHRQALWCRWRRRQGQQGEAEEVCGANGRS
jgi:hypothetical protein